MGRPVRRAGGTGLRCPHDESSPLYLWKSGQFLRAETNVKYRIFNPKNLLQIFIQFGLCNFLPKGNPWFCPFIANLGPSPAKSLRMGVMAMGKEHFSSILLLTSCPERSWRGVGRGPKTRINDLDIGTKLCLNVSNGQYIFSMFDCVWTVSMHVREDRP